MTRHTHELYGCSPEPLASYLKALGTLRTLAMQRDPDATGYWNRDCFVLETELDSDALIDFFLNQYAPSPVVSPWSSSSGFGPEGKDGLKKIEDSNDPRLAVFGEVVAVARRIGDEYKEFGWPKKLDAKQKERFITQCRAEFPDAGLAWIDTAAIVADDKAAWPPIVGTGGNVGRLDISRNFHEHLLRLLGIVSKKGDAPRDWIVEALFDSVKSKWIEKSASQFNPGASGGTNSSPMGKAEGLVNPYDFVLTVEGTLFFAGGISRRFALGAKGTASAPFMSYGSPGGISSVAADEIGPKFTKGEIWTPLWQRPSTFNELRRLFSEGRADWGKHHIRSGLDLAKAAGSLGVDRGIAAFARNVFVVRDGQNAIALQAGRIKVGRQPSSATTPLKELDLWLNTVRRASDPPTAVSSALLAVEKRSFGVASGRDVYGLLPLLVEVAKLEAAVSRSTRFREDHNVRPVYSLDGRKWIEPLLKCSKDPELRIAMVLASSRDLDGKGGLARNLRMMLRPVTMDSKSRSMIWTRHPEPVAGLGYLPVSQVLARAHARRVVELARDKRTSNQSEADEVGIRTRWQRGLYADLSDVAALASGSIDEGMLSDYLSACMLLDWTKAGDKNRLAVRDGSSYQDPFDKPVPPALEVLGPFYADERSSNQRRVGDSGNDRSWDDQLATSTLCPESSWPAMLAMDRLNAAVDGALQRLRIAGLQPIMDTTRRTTESQSTDGQRIGAALLCRLSNRDRVALLRRSCPDVDVFTRLQGAASNNKTQKPEETTSVKT